MPQTLLAMVAMMVAMLFMMNQHRNVLHMRNNQMANEINLATTAVAMDRLENIGAHAFDERVIDTAQTSSSGLTPEGSFVSDAPDNDIDDFDSAEKDLHFVLDTDTLWFRSLSEVSYADEEDPEQEVDIPTKAKKTTVRVYSLTISNPDTVELSRSYYCGSKCDW